MEVDCSYSVNHDRIQALSYVNYYMLLTPLVRIEPYIHNVSADVPSSLLQVLLAELGNFLFKLKNFLFELGNLFAVIGNLLALSYINYSMLLTPLIRIEPETSDDCHLELY